MELGISGKPLSQRREHVAVEFWGIGLAETPYGDTENGVPREYANNTYKGILNEAEEYAY